jgi:two-component system, OmpR family, phosphate regulon sensor histidine kinase PhoR
MWSSRLFWKLFVSYAVLNLAATVTFVVIVSGWQEDQVVDQVRHRLRASAALVRSDVLELLPAGRSDPLQALVRRLGDEIDTRITLVAMDGMVLADSEHANFADVTAMENHKDRLELVQAATAGHGTSERSSPTLGEPMLYVALRADRDSKPVGFVRTALSMTKIRAQVATIQNLIWIVASSVSLAVVALTYFVAARIVRPISVLTSAAESIAAGDYRRRVFKNTTDELGTLADSFNHMSERLEAREAQLRENRERLATVLEGMVEGVIALDDRERIVLANGAAGRLLSFTPAEAEGRPLLEVVRNHSIHKAQADSQSVEGSRRIEVELGDETNRVLGVNSTFLSGESSTHCILVLQDVTDLRRLESMRQEFVANVSHELKTPLSSIKAYTETLLAGAIDDQQNNTRFVRRIEEQAERLHELILDMLSLARIESGRQAFDITSVNIRRLVESCLLECEAAADSNGIQLTTDEATPDLHVRADEEGVRQILNNLIDNAIKHTPEGGEVAVRLSQEETMVVIEVRDTGLGIAAEHLPRVFERFYRVDKARSRELGGTGLGLSIVKHLTHSFDGTVEVTSQLGKGSTFVVKLPLV